MRRFLAHARLTHTPARELNDGAFTAYAEPTAESGEVPILRVHSADYVASIEDAPAPWAAAGRSGDAEL